uniref:GAG-pre-integrase domain-containing protein n=1 Tax=Tanacetum cinerariifolium TaxID=118510 RepID=A0A6L2KD34_TANCI|nr:hypothetical protein [Tanacetum cinerariifolium]
MILSGADNRLPMLDKDLYDSWKSKMELYMQNREHGKMILESVENGQFIWPTIKENGVTRTKKYVELSAEKIQADCDMKATNIILQGDDPIACLNKAMAFLIAIASSRVTVQQVQGRQGQSYSGTGYKSNATSSGGTMNGTCYKDKAMLAEAQEAGQILDEEQLAFLADLGVPDAVLVANISNYDSDVISEEEADILRDIIEQAKAKQPSDKELDFAWNGSQLMNFISKFLGTVRFENDHIARIIGYGDYQFGNVIISRKNTCFIRNLDGVDVLLGFRDRNLYIISLDDMLKTSPICLLSKVSKSKSWLWHRWLSHLNFNTPNKLAKDDLVRGILRLKFQKDHLCLACTLGKSEKSSHQPKAEDTNQEKLYLLHMDLCSPMRVTSINEKRYILVIVEDYSRFT